MSLAVAIAMGLKPYTILERPAVAGVIVGTRLGVAQHLDDSARVFGFATDEGDEAKIETVLANRATCRS
jgi:hypothetical protein